MLITADNSWERYCLYFSAWIHNHASYNCHIVLDLYSMMFICDLEQYKDNVTPKVVSYVYRGEQMHLLISISHTGLIHLLYIIRDLKAYDKTKHKV